MKRLATAAAVVLILAPISTTAQLVAEQVTAGNASSRLFQGTDADGGIGDWYLSNGALEAIIDDVGPQPDPFGLPLTMPPKASEAAPTGGTLIDLGLVGADNDQLSQIFTVGGLSTSNFILYDDITAVTAGTSAAIIASGTLLGFDTGGTPVPPSNLPVVTEYRAAGSDRFLTITTTVTNTHPTNAAVNLGGFLDAAIWTQRSVVPFSPLPSRGFNHPILDLGNPFPALELPKFSAGPGNITPADGIIDPESGAVAGEVAYGLLGMEVSVDQNDGNGPTVTTVANLFGISSNLVTALGNMPAVGSLKPGGVLSYVRRVYVGDRNDVASVANAMITELGTRESFATGTISGNVDAADTPDVATSAIATKVGGVVLPGFDDTGPAPITQFRTAADGSFSGIILPVGVYDIEFQAAERDPVTVSGVTVTAATDTPLTIPSLSGLGTLELTVRKRVAGAPNPNIPAKVTIKGIDGTPDPNFRHDFDAFAIPLVGDPVDITPETFGGGPAQRNWVYLADGTGSVQLRPGKYELFATRGPEYSVKRRRVKIKEGRTRKRRLTIRKLVDTSGVISADFHIHSARSFDTNAALVDRVATFAAEGVQVMVSTDHDYHVDYSPIITSLGIGSEMTSIVGNEVTTSNPNPPAFPDALGHINAWPVTVAADEPRDGSIQDELVAPNLLYSLLRNQGAEVVQYNHPRAGVAGLTSIGFFNNIGYDPDVEITSAPNDVLLDDDVLGPGISGVSNPDGFRNLDFDAMEIINGTSINGYVAMRRDWFSLLNQTDFATVPFIAGTGVSDSHRLTVESAGYARTYVGGAGDDPAALNVTTFNSNVRAGNMTATTGPFIRFSIEDTGAGSAGLGGTLVPATDVVTLRIQVQATNWIPVEEVRVYANGFLVETFDETTSPAVKPGPKNPRSQSKGKVVRFDADIELAPLGQDTYFIVEAGAKLSPTPTSPPFIDQLVPDMVPLGFTNPIFVDLAGDGFDPPGLPVQVAATVIEDERPAFARLHRADESIWRRIQTWGLTTFAAAYNRGRAVACGEVDPLTGRDLQEAVESARSRPTDDYFPLYRFSIPEEAVDQAIDQLPEPQRSRLRAQREPAK